MQPNLNDKIKLAKASGYSDTEIQSYLQGAGFQAPAPQGAGLRVSTPRVTPTQAPATSRSTQIGGRKGIATSLISEGGALGGAAIGAAAGSVVPVIGTAIGGVIGAGLGAFGGRLLENQVRDERFGVTDALKEGAISALLSGPLKLGKYGVTAGKGFVAGKGAQQALTEAAKQASNLTLRGLAGTGAAKATETAITKQFKLPASFLSNFKGKFGVTAPAVLNQYGINNIDDVVVKGINPLQSAFDDIVSQSPKLSKTQVLNSLKKIYQPYIDSPVLQLQSLGQAVKGQADELAKFVGKGGVDPKDLNIIKAQFDKLAKQTVAKTPEHNLSLNVANGLRKILQDNADNAGLAYNGAPLSKIGKELQKLRYLDDALKSKEFVGAGASPVSLTGLLGATAGSAVGGVPGGLVGYATVAGLNSPAGRSAARKIINVTSERLSKSAAKALAKPAKQAVLGTGRAELLKAAYNLATQQPTTLEDALAESVPSYLSEAGLAGAGATAATTEEVAAQNPFTPELLITAIAADPKNSAVYERLYKVYEDKYKAAEPKKLTEAQQARSDIKDLAQGAVDLLNTGQVKTGAISGRFEQAKGVLGIADPTTLEFNTLISNLLATIAKARAGTSFTAGEKQLLQQYAPKVGDSGQQLRTKLALLQKQFGTDTGTTVTSPQEQMLELLSSQTGGAQ